MKYPSGFVVVFVVVAACGPKPVPTEATAVGSLDQPFDAMDHETRIAFMKERVVPVMAPIFQRHNAERFARFDCVTCHGEAAKAGDFVMPNDKLPKIGNDVMKKYERADIEWMLNEVKPTMARLLKQQEWSPADSSGFDCFACHPRQ